MGFLRKNPCPKNVALPGMRPECPVLKRMQRGSENAPPVPVIRNGYFVMALF